MLNQGLIEDQGIISSQMGFYLNPTINLTSFAPLNVSPQQSFKLPFNDNDTTIPSSFAIDHATCTLTQAFLSSTTSSPKPRDHDLSSPSNLAQLVSLQRSTPNLWAWGLEGKDYQGSKRSCGEDHHLGVSTMKMKKMKARRKVREPRFCFKTMSDVDVLDDGYKWRKYGQKVVKNTLHPRSYYRCTQDNCRVKKRVERLAEDPRMVITTYEGRHVHSPSHDLDDSQGGSHGQPLLNNFFW